MGCRCIAGCNDCCVIERHTRLRAHLRRVHETIAADPDAIIRDRKIRYEVAALIIGHDDAGKFGRQIRRLGDDPDAGF